MSAFGSEHLSGLAGEIRSSVDSDQFDLSGYSESRAKDLITSAFSQPLTTPSKMIRFTFVVGGGKLVRSRYDEDLPKWLSAALREVGYMEDKSAAETFDSQGTFKQQHDTGQNLKYLIVYPRVTCSTAATKKSSDENSADAIDEKSPDYKITASEFSTFQEMIQAKVPSWRQRKKALAVLQAAQEAFKAAEAKLVAGQLLSKTEQALYDRNSGCDAEKITWLQGEIKAMVDGGHLSESEKKELLATLDANLLAVTDDIKKATEEQKPPKLLAKLEEKKSALSARKAAVEKIKPEQRRLIHGDEIQRLRKKLFALIALEERGRSMSLTLNDLKILEEKPELEEKVAGYESASRGWFEDEADFQAMCEFESREAKSKYLYNLKTQQAAKKSTSSSGGSGSAGKSAGFKSAGASGGMGAWSTIGTAKKAGSGAGGGAGGKAAGRSGFAAAFNDDSD